MAAYALFIWTTTALAMLIVVGLVAPFGIWLQGGGLALLAFVLMSGALLMPPVALSSMALSFPLFALLRRKDQTGAAPGPHHDRRAAMTSLLIVLCGALLFALARYGFTPLRGLPGLAALLGVVVVPPVGWWIAKWTFPVPSPE